MHSTFVCKYENVIVCSISNISKSNLLLNWIHNLHLLYSLLNYIIAGSSWHAVATNRLIDFAVPKLIRKSGVDKSQFQFALHEEAFHDYMYILISRLYLRPSLRSPLSGQATCFLMVIVNIAFGPIKY